MRLGATFFRRKELVEPAVDLAKEMDCIEAAIFRVICVFKSVFLWWWFGFFRVYPFSCLSNREERRRDFWDESCLGYLAQKIQKKATQNNETAKTSSRPKQALLLVSSCWYCLRWWETESSDRLFISSGSDCDSSDDDDDSDDDDGFFYFFFFNPLLFRF